MWSNELKWESEERKKKAFNKQLCVLIYLSMLLENCRHFLREKEQH